MFQLFDELQGHESYVAHKLREVSDGLLSLGKIFFDHGTETDDQAFQREFALLTMRTNLPQVWPRESKLNNAAYYTRKEHDMAEYEKTFVDGYWSSGDEKRKQEEKKYYLVTMGMWNVTPDTGSGSDNDDDAKNPPNFMETNK
ncbi:hypothetical protein LXL04_038241 [Taraxacum kok-saghyz]